MAKRDIMVIGASAGGIFAIRDLVAALPVDFPAAIFIVQHIAADTKSMLPEILSHAGALKAYHPTDGEPIRWGRIYVAPPDHHLLVEHGKVLVKRGPKENRFRPSIDALFRSAAYNYGPRVIGVILTGLLNDGTSGMWSVKRLGGVSVVQHPQDALYPSMPESVLQDVVVDYTAPISQLVDLLTELTRETAGTRPVLQPLEDRRMATEVKMAEEDTTDAMSILEEGDLTPLTCPECHGSLVSIKEGKLIRYRCHTGHGFSAGSLLAGVNNSVEESLWNAIRSLEETILLLEQTATGLAERGDQLAAREYTANVEEAKERIRQLRPLIFNG